MLIALFISGAEVKNQLPLDKYGSREKCIMASIEMGYDALMYETSRSVILDNNKVDGYAVMCITKESKA